MQKFIISKEGELILGNVEFHFELLGKNYSIGCWGGGFWRVDKESKTLILAGNQQTSDLLSGNTSKNLL